MFFVNRPRMVCSVETIGTRIRRLRQAKDLTQVQFGERVGITQSTLSLIESGKTVDIRGTTLASMCAELRTTAEHIMFGTQAIGGALTPIESEAVQLLRQTSDENRDAAMRVIRAIAIPEAKRKAG